MNTLLDYTDVKKPVVAKDRPVQVQTEDGARRMVGFIGRDVARGSPTVGYVSQRTEEKHFFKKEQGYPIADQVIEQLKECGVSEILIVEDSSKTVYEFDPVDYYKGTRVKEDGFEEQRCVPVSDYIRKYKDYSSDVTINNVN